MECRMKEIKCIIVSEEMVWLFYYDEFRKKYLKELYVKEAREFIKQRQTEIKL
jgi:hypothetical protein